MRYFKSVLVDRSSGNSTGSPSSSSHLKKQTFHPAQAKLRDKSIPVAKSPHSGTAIFQECDAGSLFKAAKTVNQKLKTKHILDPIVKYRVENTFAIHDATMNPMRESTNTLAPTKTKKGTANRKTGAQRSRRDKRRTTKTWHQRYYARSADHK